ncbi:hypothetical protein F2Q70_00005993 [Brassica cretica]|uniref:Uncharacterized protein n=1 Tax=Brassica cretica TaxID=69181 RepID=A0A8S9IS51_BRACR|nr:hypothetical protein F2Q70_00005993 [Brassica cretica]
MKRRRLHNTKTSQNLLHSRLFQNTNHNHGRRRNSNPTRLRAPSPPMHRVSTTVHMIKKKSKESFIAFKEALKFKRDSWQMWENFSHVAMDVGNIDQAFEAIQKILSMSKNKRVDVVLLDRIMTELENRNSASSLSVETEASSDESTESKPCAATPAETQRHLELLGKIIQQIVRTESTSEIWGLYARWSRIKGDLMVCSEALLKQVRSYQGSELWKDKERFKKFARASLELCRVYMEISVSTGSKRELFSAEMHLKNTIKQATVSFPESEELKELESCLEEDTCTIIPIEESFLTRKRTSKKRKKICWYGFVASSPSSSLDRRMASLQSSPEKPPGCAFEHEIWINARSLSKAVLGQVLFRISTTTAHVADLHGHQERESRGNFDGGER